MQLILILLSFGLLIEGQDVIIDDDLQLKIDEIFLKPVNHVTEKCGEGSTAGKKICVKYDMCDQTNTIVQSGVKDGFGVIDIRYYANSCAHYLDICCKIPTEGLSPNLRDANAGTNHRTGDYVGVNQLIPTPSTPVRKPSFCGKRNPNGIDFRMAGNKNNEAEYGEFPWMVAIINKNNFHDAFAQTMICGGSLITPNVVLTAGHCVSKYQYYDLAIRAGEWDTQTTKERLPYQERNVKRIIVHENFNSGNLRNDFALLILDESVNKADNIGTICLPSEGARINSTHCFVSGWGKAEFGKRGKYAVIMKKIELPIVEKGKCQDDLRSTRLGRRFGLHTSFMCAGGEAGKDACTGDGGSPLVCPDPQNPQRYVQVGIVAWGIGCGSPNIPGVYADVTNFRYWIDEQLRRLNINTTPYTI